MCCSDTPDLLAVFTLFLPVGMLAASGGGLLLYLVRGGSRLSTVLCLSLVGLLSFFLLLAAMAFVSGGGGDELLRHVGRLSSACDEGPRALERFSWQ